MTDTALAENTDLGAAGDPTETAQTNMARKLNNKAEQKPKKPPQQKPKPAPQKPTPPEPKVAGPGHEGDIPKVTAAEQQQGQKQTEQQWAQRPLRASNPLLNAIESVPDAGWLGYQAARYVMNGMQQTQYQQVGRYTNNTAQMWEQHNAQARISQALMTVAAWSPPGLVLRGLYDLAYSGGHQPLSKDPNEAAAEQLAGGAIGLALDPTAWTIGATGGLGDIPGLAGAAGKVGAKVAGEEAGKVAAEEAPAEAQAATEAGKAAEEVPAESPAGTTAGAAGKAAQIAGKAAPRVAENLAYNIANDPNLNPQSFLWDLSLAILFGNGHLGSGARAMLKRMGPTWERLGTQMADNYGAAVAHQMQQKGDPSEYFKAIIGDLADTGAVEPFEKTEREVAPKSVLATMDEAGQITMKPRAGTEAALQQMGLESMAELNDALSKGTLSPRQILALKRNWRYLGLPYDMVRVGDGEAPLVNPAEHMDQIAPEHTQNAHNSMTMLRMFVDQSYRSPMGNHEKPLVSLWRSLIGYNRATDKVHRDLMDSWLKLLSADGNTKANREAITRAVEGDEQAYEALTPAQKMVADSWRIAAAALRRRSKETGYAYNFVANWFPRVPVAEPGAERARTGAAAILRGERRKARSVRAVIGEGEEGPRIELRQKFDSVFDLNKAQAQVRQNLIDDMLDPQGPKNMAGVSRATLAQIRTSGNRELANEIAWEKAPDFETDFLVAANKSLGRQLAAIHSKQAMDHLAETTIRSAEGNAIPAAVRTAGLKGFDLDALANKGYVRPDSPWFRGYMVYKDFNDLLRRSQRAAEQSPTLLSKGILGLEQRAIKNIMYSPMLHGMNMAGRLGAAWTMHPIAMTRHILGPGFGRRLANIFRVEDVGDDLDYYARKAAYNAGVLPFSRYRNYGPEMYATYADAFGDQVIGEHPGVTDTSELPAWAQNRPDLKNLAKPLQSAHSYLSNILWSNIGDFGVMMYHLEATAFEKAGMSPEKASMLAARRANSWMGHVAPEDTNPLWHDIFRSLLFAPNWLRTWAELLTGVYRNAGFNWDRKTVALHAANEVRTFLAMFGYQKLTGNVFNLAMSGHPQWQNQPENQDKIEITRPEMIRMAQSIGLGQGIDPNTGYNPQNGQVLTIENPFARQQLMTETAAGLESGQPGYDPSNIFPGISKEAASRLSPVLNAAAALNNVDLYNTIAKAQLTHLNAQEPVSPHADNLLMALAYMTPLGYKAAQGIEQVEGVYGTQPPPTVQQALGGVKNAGIQTILSGLTGINPPVAYGEKSPGQPLSDQEYMQIDQINKQYDQQMTSLQNSLVSGSITPDQWRQEYENLTIQRATTLQAFYNNSPEYTQGTDGLMAQWEALYSDPRVMNADGSVNEDVLLELQQQFQADHTQAQMNALNGALSKTEQKYPAVKMYKDALQSYYNFQDDWAQKNGISVYDLIKESKEMQYLYGTPAMYRYLGQHPDLARWENAKKVWLRSSAGRTYGLFEGSSTAMKISYGLGLASTPQTQIQRTGNLQLPAQEQLDQEILNGIVQDYMAQGIPAAQAEMQANALLTTGTP